MSGNFTPMYSLLYCFPCYIAGYLQLEAQNKHTVMPNSSCSCLTGTD